MRGGSAGGRAGRRADVDGNDGRRGGHSGLSEKGDSSATARLLGNIGGSVYSLGDNVQGNGDINEFRNCYDPTWGKYKKRTKPAVGNHEY